MASSSFVRYVAGSNKGDVSRFYLRCRVKPGVSKAREGLTALTDEIIEICVAARAREGEANKAVLAVLSKVRLSAFVLSDPNVAGLGSWYLEIGPSASPWGEMQGENGCDHEGGVSTM
jgi:hypothetical protein